MKVHVKKEPGLSVLISGHTGATGSFLLDRLIADDDVARIVALGRRHVTALDAAPKVQQIVVADMADLSGVDPAEVGDIDIAFDLVATPLKEAFNGEEAYRKVDVDIATECARFARSRGARFLGAIAVEGADSDRDFGKDYSRPAKRDFIRNVRAMGFERIAMLYPAWVSREQGFRLSEFLFTWGGRKGVKASAMAKVLAWAAQNQETGERAYSEKEIKRIATQG
ncbi:NAD-dependent epimerase/dehydratase family protein [Corynebacterium oculi]|uniref:NAD-dependent epimerase/dehydratase domain-containing protein n=1 Tax=Corynebacterium oculi TaxID=1544416 RepID=A0A0Q0UEE0_9CORY|nr:NAD-dependent epimerase/dehydratase family protein [Corynebacterium oculi]KQB85014.1 hypothetical protein Cocul_00147 [Corynebacterium oculi]